jgi:uncharacterized membrane protein YcaP (DUF421 family)
MGHIFQFQVSPGELILRGTLVYWFLFVLFRFILRRDAGSLGLADILVVVLVADAAQNGMSGEYKSVSEAMVLVGTIAGWNYFIDWMSFRFSWFAQFAEPRVVTLVEHGQVHHQNLQREMVTEDELHSQLRQNGVDDIEDVKHARLEPDGHVSVIRVAETDSRSKTPRFPGST